MSKECKDSRTNTTTKPEIPNEGLTVYEPKMLQLNTVYGITINPKEQFLKDNFRFLTIFSTFFHTIQKSHISKYVIYPEISSPNESINKKGKPTYPRLHFHGTFELKTTYDYCNFYQFGFNALAKLGSLEIHHKLNPSYSIKDKGTMKPICKMLKVPYVLTKENITSKLKDKDFYNRGLEHSKKILKALFGDDFEDDLLED